VVSWNPSIVVSVKTTPPRHHENEKPHNHATTIDKNHQTPPALVHTHPKPPPAPNHTTTQVKNHTAPNHRTPRGLFLFRHQCVNRRHAIDPPPPNPAKLTGRVAAGGPIGVNTEMNTE
jgi:hypothetical protein